MSLFDGTRPCPRMLHLSRCLCMADWSGSTHSLTQGGCDGVRIKNITPRLSEWTNTNDVGRWLAGGGNQFYPTVRECDFLLDSSSSSYNFFLCHFLSAKICRRSINNLQRSRAGGWAGQVEVWAEETAGQTKSVHTCSTLYVCGSCFASSPHPLFYPFPWHTTYHQPPQTGLGFRILLQVFRGRSLAGDMR